MTVAQRACWGLTMAVAAWIGGASAADSARLATPAAAAPAAKATSGVYRMNAMLTYEPVWMVDSRRLAFLGNQQAGGPMHVYIWEPITGTLGRTTATASNRHSLAVSTDGRIAYVEHQAKPPAASEPTGDAAQPQPGPDTLVVQDLRTNTTLAVLADGWVLPKSVSWSPDGARLAFITIDRTGQQRLALVTPGQPITMVQLDRSYEFQGMVGWANAREVLLSGTALGAGAPGTEQLLLVGRNGVRAFRPALEPRLSPDGRWLLAKNSAAGGLALRLVTGGSRLLSASANAFDWAPEADRVYAAVDRDVVLLNMRGKVLRRWPALASLALGQVLVSPDGKYLAYNADYGLAAIRLK